VKKGEKGGEERTRRCCGCPKRDRSGKKRKKEKEKKHRRGMIAFVKLRTEIKGERKGGGKETRGKV